MYRRETTLGIGLAVAASSVAIASGIESNRPNTAVLIDKTQATETVALGQLATKHLTHVLVDETGNLSVTPSTSPVAHMASLALSDNVRSTAHGYRYKYHHHYLLPGRLPDYKLKPNLSTTQGRGQFIYDRLTKHGLTGKAACGSIGNSAIEDTDFVPTTPGGIVQWGGSRLSGLVAYAAAKHQSTSSLPVQVNYEIQELEDGPYATGGGYRSVMQEANAATTIPQATYVFMNNYEKPLLSNANPGGRVAAATTMLKVCAELNNQS